jgi:uncharacterized membrane protein (UPF0127 family)
MMEERYKVLSKGIELGVNVKIASTFYDRLVGLMFRKSMLDSDGLLINPCRSIHTFFMRYEIDVLFLDSNYKIVRIIRHLKPWKMTWLYWKASQVLEFYGGTLPEGIIEGDTLEVVCIS